MDLLGRIKIPRSPFTPPNHHGKGLFGGGRGGGGEEERRSRRRVKSSLGIHFDYYLGLITPWLLTHSVTVENRSVGGGGERGGGGDGNGRGGFGTIYEVFSAETITRIVTH